MRSRFWSRLPKYHRAADPRRSGHFQQQLPELFRSKEGVLTELRGFYSSNSSRQSHGELKSRRISVTAVCPGPMATEFIQVGRIAGKSRTFDVLPYCEPTKVVSCALRAAKKGRAVYTRALYKFYRVLSALVPHAIMIKFAKT